MMKKSLLLAGIALLPSLLYGQQKKLSLDAVVVTANKFNQKASGTGKVMTIITQKDLQQRSGETLGTILDEQPGITINGSSESPGTNQTVYMRGADPKYTLIMIDGVPVNDVSYNDYKFDINLIPLSAIERIEIMRGGYAALYGSGGAAGVINIITKKGGQRPFNVTAGFTGGSYGTFREQAGISGHQKKIDYNVQLQNFDSKGFSSALDTTGSQGFDKDGYRRQSVYAGLGFHPNENWSIRPFVHFAYEKGNMDADAFVDDKDYYYTTVFWQTGLSLQHTFDKGDLNLKYSFNPTDRHYLNDSLDGSDYAKSKYGSVTHSVDAYIHYIISPHISLLFGNSIRLEKTNQHGVNIFGPYIYKNDLSADSAQTNAMDIYGSFFLKTDNGFHLELGGRLNQHKLYGSHPVFSINPSWLINDRIKFFANIASTFSSPSLYQLYSVYGNQKLKPETGISYEGGMEALFAHQKLKLRLTAYDRNLKKVIAFQTSRYINYDHQTGYGGEAELDYAVNDKLRIKAYYAYLNGRVTAKNAGTKKDSTYNNLFKRPENAAGISIGYQLAPSFYISMDGKYTGSREDLAFINNSQQIRHLKNYIIVNLYAQYVWKTRYKLFLGLHNITDSRYTETTGFTTKRFNFETGVQWSLF
jgi:vitamin B12 transporter